MKKRNCVLNYIKNNKPKKDIVVYQYQDKTEYLLALNSMGGFDTYNKNTLEKITDAHLLKLIWCNSSVLCDYITDIIALQVNFGE